MINEIARLVKISAFGMLCSFSMLYGEAFSAVPFVDDPKESVASAVAPINTPASTKASAVEPINTPDLTKVAIPTKSKNVAAKSSIPSGKVNPNELKDSDSQNSNNLSIKVGGELDFSSYYAKNADPFVIGHGGHFVNRLYKSKGVLSVNPSTDMTGSGLESKDHDGGVLGDYSSNFGLATDAFFYLSAENKLNDELKYGAKIGIGIGTDNSRELKTSEAYIFVGSEYGTVEFGSMDGVAERMRLDASSLSSLGGGIAGPWFAHGNVEGSYIDAVYNKSTPNSSKRNRDVLRPFHVLPMLYSEYTHKSGPWKRRDNDVVGIHAPTISYYSPVFENGLSFGVSYIHDEATLYNVDVAHVEREEYKDIIAAGFKYERAIENLKIKVAFTGEKGNYRDDLKNQIYNYNDLAGWNLGTVVGYAGVKFAASFANLYKSGLPKKAIIDSNLNVAVPSATDVDPGDTTYLTLGASYEVGPALVSLEYFRSSTKPLNQNDENILNNYSINSHYHLTGKKTQLTPYVSFNYFTTSESFTDGNIPGYDNNEGYVILAGIKMSF